MKAVAGMFTARSNGTSSHFMDSFFMENLRRIRRLYDPCRKKINVGNISVDQKSDPFKNAQRATLPRQFQHYVFIE